MLKKLLFITAICLALNACSKQDNQNEYSEYDYDYDRQELIVVSRTPRGAWAEGNDWANEVSPEFRHIGWYEIDLSRNGKEPVEYIWRANDDPCHYAIIRAEIGDKGTVHLEWLAKQNKIKLPRPNTENPPVIGTFGEVYWERQE